MSGAGLYGKVSTQPDFLRAGAGSFSQAGLDRWFQDGMELLRSEGTSLPATPTAFLLAPPDAAVAFVGVFAPSADAAGRSFPLVVFSEVDAAGLPDMLPSVPAAAAPFLNDAVMLTIAAASADGPDAGRAGAGVEARFLGVGRATKRGASSRAPPCWTRWAVHRPRWRTRCERCRWPPTARARAAPPAGVTVDAPAPTARGRRAVAGDHSPPPRSAHPAQPHLDRGSRGAPADHHRPAGAGRPRLSWPTRATAARSCGRCEPWRPPPRTKRCAR